MFLAACSCGLVAQQALTPPASQPLTSEEQLALHHISADSLRGHLSFIASDLLEGRNTPSRGLDIAAEYIAAQFRRAGLEPAGDDGYFQTAVMVEREPVQEGFEMTIQRHGHKISIPPDQAVPRFNTPLELSSAAIYKIERNSETAPNADQLEGKVVATELPEFEGGGVRQAQREYRRLMGLLVKARPQLTLILTSTGPAELNTRLLSPQIHDSGDDRWILVRSSKALRWYRSLPPGLSDATLTLRLPRLVEEQVKLRNVIGILRGSDADLKDSCVMLTAHYDHLGMKPDGNGDRIYNGANDDGSGTVSVIEIASALTTLKPRPKRSLVFLTFYGEEEGTLGSQYYAQHPVFPLVKTVADVNLEQLGRTDATDGKKLSEATFTGFDYSDLPRLFQKAGARVGVRVLSDEPYGDSYFSRGDNISLAEAGVPAHTLAVAFEFPDYHTVSDEWQKIDYDNMAKVDRMVALGLIMLADDPAPPKWNEADRKTEPYVRAWKERLRQQ